MLLVMHANLDGLRPIIGRLVSFVLARQNNTTTPFSAISASDALVPQQCVSSIPIFIGSPLNVYMFLTAKVYMTTIYRDFE